MQKYGRLAIAFVIIDNLIDAMIVWYLWPIDVSAFWPL